MRGSGSRRRETKLTDDLAGRNDCYTTFIIEPDFSFSVESRSDGTFRSRTEVETMAIVADLIKKENADIELTKFHPFAWKKLILFRRFQAEIS